MQIFSVAILAQAIENHLLHFPKTAVCCIIMMPGAVRDLMAEISKKKQKLADGSNPRVADVVADGGGTWCAEYFRPYSILGRGGIMG